MIAATKTSETTRQLIETLGKHLGQLTAQTIVETSCWRAKLMPGTLRAEDLAAVVPEVEKGIRLFVKESFKQQLCLTDLAELARPPAAQRVTLVKIPITDEGCMLDARSKARQMCVELGFSLVEQTQVATVVSELARNIVLYAGTGTITLIIFPSGRRGVQITAEDHGPGIPDLAATLSGTRRSKTGMGLGLRGSRNLMDHFDIDTGPGKGTRVVATKYRR